MGIGDTKTINKKNNILLNDITFKFNRRPFKIGKIF